MDYNNDYNYADNRARDSFFRDKETNSLVCVISIDLRGEAIVKVVETDEVVAKNVSKIDFSSAPLGFINHAGRALYCTRIPCRGGGYKQGLTARNIEITNETLGEPKEIARQRVGFDILSKAVGGKYPEVSQCLKEVRSGNQKAIAFDRAFAVSRSFDKGSVSLIYKNFGEVGSINESNEIKLSKEFLWLREYLQEIINEKDISIAWP